MALALVRTHPISYALILVGMVIMGIGFEIIIGGMMIMGFTDLVQRYPPELKNEIGTLLELREQIQNLLQKQSFEMKHSEGLTWIGTGAALFVSGIPLVLSGRKDISDFKKANDFLIDDFLELHVKLLTVIKNLKDAETDLRSNCIIVNNLINKKGMPLDLIRNYIAGLFFSLWDSAMDQFKYLPKQDQKILKKLHNFILESNGYISPRENSLVFEVEKILSSSSQNISKELTQKLLEVFQANLHHYEVIYQVMHRELDLISWIPNRVWNKEIDTVKPKKIIIDNKGTYHFE